MDFELIFWIVAGFATMITAGVLWVLAKKEEMNYVNWVAEGDWK